jgi:protein-S-isoprenylcysteine O-methyltransferase Ste14
MMSTEELPLRRMAVCASGLIYWGGVLVQARRIRKRIGRSPNLKPRGAKEQALWVGWFVVILAWIGQPFLVGTTVVKPGLASWPGLLHPASLLAGLVLVVLGYAGTLWTYAAMGDTWRIGVDPKERTALVSRGPYRWVRHPIYLFQIVMLAGAALLLPTVVSFATLAAHWTCVLIKAGDEERYLTMVHGAAYRDYLSRTGRLFPRWIRRRSAAKNQARSGIDL